MIAELTVITPLLESPICSVRAVMRSSSSSVRLSEPAVSVPKLMGRETVCCTRVVVPLVVRDAVPEMATVSAVMVADVELLLPLKLMVSAARDRTPPASERAAF